MEWRSLTRVVSPTVEPLIPREIYDHLRLVEDDEEKGYADSLAIVAREWVENRNGIAVMTQTWLATYDGWWDGVLDLPYPPLQSVAAIEYLDVDGVLQTLDPANYVVLNGSPVAQIAWAPSAVRPALSQLPGNVRVRFVAGLSDQQSVPATIKQSILIMVGTWFENRESVVIGTIAQKVPMSVQSLLDQTRVRWW
jgi:uncharacterized phiE125 gp8 family phage protein